MNGLYLTCLFLLETRAQSESLEFSIYLFPLLKLAALFNLGPSIRVQISVSAPSQVSLPPSDNPNPPPPSSDQLDFDEISQISEWRARATLESTTPIKMFSLFYCGILSDLFPFCIQRSNMRTRFLGNCICKIV